MTKIIIDSTCDLSPQLIKRFNFSVLPLSVIIDCQAYEDEEQLDAVYAAMRAGRPVSTAQIQWEDAERVFMSTLDAGDDFIYLAFSSSMSGTFALAELICEELRAKYPHRRITVVDSRGGSMGSGLIAAQLGLMNESGADYDQLLEQCQWMTDHVKYAFTIEDLKCAVRGGRVLARVAGNIGDILNVKPIMDVKNGMLHLVRFARGTKQSLATVADTVAAHAASFGNQLISISHADDTERAETMKKLLRERLPDCSFLCQRIGGVLGAHLGIGGVGVSCMDKRPPLYYTL